MRYSQLRAFHHVAVHGGFSAAAAALHQTQPALSDQVKRLEQDHDVLLFSRDGRRVRLTPAGEDLLLLTRQYFEVEDRIASHLQQARAAVTGTLRIVADSALHVTDALGAFRARHPDVFVRLTTGNSQQVLAALRNYDAEIGILGSLDPAPDLDCRDLGETPIVAIVARGFLPPGTVSLSLSDLRQMPLVFRETGSRTRAALETAARSAGARLTPVIEVEGREAMREVVASGAGIGFVSEAELGYDPRIERVPLSGMSLAMTETLVNLSMRRDLPVIRAFLREIDGAS
ncbi:LysR substrate-binding domain-containing protein [Marivivens marinus]|uniref:LysR substrate-binding domain-containing protein n=1 Tax=Marivivens marinus TaxID=3110173 RepID=UPI003B84B2A5